MALTSGKVQFLFLHHWCQVWLRAGLWNFSPNSLLRRLETVLEPIAVPFKRKISRIILRDLFGERITVRLIEWSSLGVVFRERPEPFLS